MPSLEQDSNRATYQIRSYLAGNILINETHYHQSLIITPTQLIKHWPPQSVLELTPDSFDMICPLKPDILLIGTGSNFVFLPLELYGHLYNLHIGVEIMDTGAACRTFNALTAEERNVVAALLI